MIFYRRRAIVDLYSKISQIANRQYIIQNYIINLCKFRSDNISKLLSFKEYFMHFHIRYLFYTSFIYVRFLHIIV